MTERCVPIRVVLQSLLRAQVPVVLENRPMRYMFGTLNYGEVPGCRNAADGDCWDVFAPGYAHRLPFTAYDVTDVIGVLWIENGNHKIAVRLDAPGYDATRAEREIQRYARTYLKHMRLRGRWLKRHGPMRTMLPMNTRSRGEHPRRRRQASAPSTSSTSSTSR